jgi:hypothetical protein
LFKTSRTTHPFKAKLFSSDRSCDTLSYIVDLSLCVWLNVQYSQTQKLVTVIVVVVVVVTTCPITVPCFFVVTMVTAFW